MSNTKQCEMCAHFIYDDEYEENICNMDRDEDELISFYQSRTSCPYFKFYDEYKMVRKQNWDTFKKKVFFYAFFHTFYVF